MSIQQSLASDRITQPRHKTPQLQNSVLLLNVSFPLLTGSPCTSICNPTPRYTPFKRERKNPRTINHPKKS